MALVVLNGWDIYKVARIGLGWLRSWDSADGPEECPGCLEWSERL